MIIITVTAFVRKCLLVLLLEIYCSLLDDVCMNDRLIYDFKLGKKRSFVVTNRDIILKFMAR